MIMNKETMEEFFWKQSTAERVDALADAKREEKKIKAHTSTYVNPIFKRYAFARPDGRPIKDHGQLYLVEGQEERIKAYYADLDVAHMTHGYRIPAGYCPALMADHARIKAENALLAHAVACGVLPKIPLNLDHRKKALELIVSGFLALRVA